MLTTKQLEILCPRLNNATINKLVVLINAKCQEYKMQQGNVFNMFLANLLHESGHFTIYAENMNYSTPQRLVDVWPSRFSIIRVPNKLMAKDYIRNPQLLANTVYALRMGNGGVSSGDGFRYRGGGFAQITGLDAYKLYSEYLQTKGFEFDIKEVAEKVMHDIEFALDSAFWFYCIWKNLEQFALANNFRELCRRWNGGFVGWNDRNAILVRVNTILK